MIIAIGSIILGIVVNRGIMVEVEVKAKLGFQSGNVNMAKNGTFDIRIGVVV